MTSASVANYYQPLTINYTTLTHNSCFSPSNTMATAEPSNNPSQAQAGNGSALPPPDKYRGAVVEVR